MCAAGRLLAAAMQGGALTPAALAAALLPAVPAQARERQAGFDIPAQDLAAALQLFASQAQVQILFPYERAAGQKSRALKGRMPTRAALEKLIAGQGLSIIRYGAAGITLAPARAASPRHVPSSPARPRQAPPPEPEESPAIVVTGRAVDTALADKDYSYAVTVIDGLEYDRNAPASTAELFRLVPGFWVEASGGEAGNNVRSRGIPTDGYSSISLAENGIPVQYDGSLGYLNTDQSYRIDETIERVEIVRGGPSSIVMPNAPGGIVNFIARSGLTDSGGLVKAQAGDHGYRRIDGYVAGRIAPGWGLLAGGFYRRDGGRRPPGYTADLGGQGRIAIDYADGDNSFSIDLRHLDDRVTFYLPVPLRFDDQGDIAAIPGFDPLRDSLAGPETRHVQMRDVGHATDFDLTRGTRTRLTALTMRGKLALDDGLALASGMRWRISETLRNALFPTGVPMTQADFLAGIAPRMQDAFPASDRLQLRYAADGTPMPANANGNGLVQGANLLTVSIPLDEMIFDNRLTYAFRRGGAHDLAIGATLAHYSYRFDRYMGTVLLDVRDGARLVDAVALDAAGQVVGSYTDHGFQRYGSIFDRVGMAVDAAALYGADEWRITPRLRIDLSARWEHEAIKGDAAAKATVDLGDPATLADDQVLTAAGSVIAVRRDFSGLGWSVGAAYELRPALGLFARYTDTFRLPSAGDFNGNPTRTDLKTVPIRMIEAGLKFGAGRVRLNATGFYTRFDRLPFTDFRFDTTTNAYEERTAIAGTESWGMELEANWRLFRWMDLALQTTWQQPRYRNFAFTELVDGAPVRHDYSGNQLIRVPKLSVRGVAGLTLLDGHLRAELSAMHFTRRYADIANSQVLPRYTLFGLNIMARPSERLRLELHMTNITNALGLTEGNPRTGSFDAGGGIDTYFLARPEFARTIRLGAAWNF